MIRAVFFDFYGVWLPDIFADYLVEAEAHGPATVQKLQDLTNQYFRGQIGAEDIAQAFRYNLQRPDIDTDQFALREQAVYPAITAFMRGLHSHFLKVGILANLGAQEYKLLTDFNTHTQVFEVIGGPLPYQMFEPLLSEVVFARALQAIGEPPRSCLVVSGNPAYLQFAQSLGIATLPFQGYSNLLPELELVLASEN